MAKKVKEYYDEYGNLVKQSTAETIAAAEAANEQWNQDMAAAEQARAAAEQANINSVTGYLNQGMNAQEALLRASEQQLRQAEAEGRQQVKADVNAAKYAGLTNLAASVANLIGVGGYNAVSQQYKDYSQDWMRKADIDMRTHRMRIDNLRERQRGVQQRLAQLKMQNNLTIAQMQADAAKAKDAYNARMADARREQAMAVAGLRSKGDDAAAQAALQGGVTQAKMDQDDAHFNASQAQQNANREMQYRLYGFEKDPKTGQWKAPEGYAGKGSGKSKSGSGSGSGGGKSGGDLYDVTIDGQQMTLRVSSNSYKQAVLDGKAEIKKDLVDITGAGSWDKLVNGLGRKGKYEQYADIVTALNGTGDNKADNETIERFLQDNRALVNNFNKHLYNVSSGASEAEQSGTWEDEFDD